MGSSLGGRFRIERELGRGGESIVLLVHHVWLANLCVLKMPVRESTFRNRRLLREGMIAASMPHRNLVRILDAGYLDDGRAYLSSEWRDTRSAQELSHGTTLPLSEVGQLATAILTGLVAVHEHGWLHLDVKPHNVLIPTVNDQLLWDDAFLIDFGVARRFEPDGPQTAANLMEWRLAGTTLYMAPEHMTGRAVSPATDIYAVGALMHQLLYGQVPTCGDVTRRYVIKAPGIDTHISAIPMRLTEHISIADSPTVPEGVRTMLERWLDLDPSNRPQRAVQALEELQQAMSPLPIPSRSTI
jgi:serine/threonine-protein kinase